MRILVIVLLMLCITSITSAETTSQVIGNYTYYDGDNKGTSVEIGNFTYYNINGKNGTSTVIGDITYYEGELFNK